MPGLVAAEGAALAVLAGPDGSPVWRLVRVLVVIAVTAVGVWVTHQAGRASRGAAALVAGIVGTVTGAGVDSAHLAKAGLDAQRAGGLLVSAEPAVLRASSQRRHRTHPPVSHARSSRCHRYVHSRAQHRPPGPQIGLCLQWRGRDAEGHSLRQWRLSR
jgi:hypothetical protein